MKKVVYCLVILIFILIIIYAVFKNTNNVEIETDITEYVPQEEISNSQNRTTLLTLYFVNPATGSIVPEVRQIDVKDIINEPYEKIMGLLLEGSQNPDVGKTIPDGTKLNGISLEKEELVIDLSKEFIDGNDVNSEKQSKIMEAISSTFRELKEVSTVSFLIDGEKI